MQSGVGTRIAPALESRLALRPPLSSSLVSSLDEGDACPPQATAKAFVRDITVEHPDVNPAGGSVRPFSAGSKGNNGNDRENTENFNDDGGTGEMALVTGTLRPSTALLLSALLLVVSMVSSPAGQILLLNLRDRL